MIDTHCHLYSDEFSSDLGNVIEAGRVAGVKFTYMPAIDSITHEKMLTVEAGFPGECIAMMGLHPCSVKENYREELSVAEGYLKSRKFAGIGEAGLDFHWDVSFKKQQYEALEMQAEWALRYKLPLILHTRNAMAETIDVIRPYAIRGVKGIFHCFGGTLAEAKLVMDLGFLLGIGGVVTYKKSGLSEVIAKTGIGNMVLETDAPYLAPVPFRGKRNESRYLPYIAECIGLAAGKTTADVVNITTANAQLIFPGL
ncbi:MAG: TatD family hydrolase [Ferruginibacter sp.]